MPSRPARICACGRRVPAGVRCECLKARDAERPNAARRGYDAEWQAASRAFLAEPSNDKCECGAPAVLVRHVVSIRRRPDLRMVRSNWKPGCRSCNARDARADQAETGGVVDDLPCLGG